MKESAPQDALSREETIFNAAVQLGDPAKRAFYLDLACENDPALRARLEKLLATEPAGDPLFDRPLAAPALLPQAPPGPVAPPPDAAVGAARPGDRVGRYKLLEKVGEGGCGVVYVAEQEEPVRRRVALKVIKLGMDTRSVIARFEAERQALALMDHPNIAKVLDAGATEDTGRPYFVMELVRGIRITDYCDQNQLSTKERLDLFIQVCQAIQHAHQKGIIHRDIKPSNILVTLHDGVPVPKVIDFGIAKATEGRLTQATIYTQLHQLIGTPAYMSPEQAEMSGLDIDTRSDIYSLGVLLYELLTGKTPFDATELISQGLDAMRKTIREKEPARPSTRLTHELVAAGQSPRKRTTGLSVPTQEEVSAESRRRLRLREQIARVRGDLDWIVMKCLEKDRARRYETANGLVADLKRHVNNEPVVARPPSAAYRFSRLVRRNRLAFAATGAVASALVIGACVASWQAVRARSAEQAARLAEQAERSVSEQAHLERDRAVRAEADAQAQAVMAKGAWFTTRRNAYAAEIHVASQALAENNLAGARELLHRQRPKPGEEDLRGFEWRYLWQLCRSDELDSFPDQGAHGVAFSPDGRLLAYGSDKIFVRDVASRSIVARISHGATTLAFSPSTNLLAGSDYSGVTLWDTETWREARSLPGSRQPAVFSPDGHWLVTGAEGGFRIWNTETWELVDFLAGAPYLEWLVRYGVAFSSDGKWLVTPFTSDPFTEPTQFQVWEFATRKRIARMAPLDGHSGSAAITPDGRHLLTGMGSGQLQVWDIEHGKKVETLSKHTGWITSIVVARDGKTFATASSDRTVVIWDVATRTPLTQFRGHTGEVWSVAMTPDGQTFASGCHDGSTKLWGLATRQKLPPELHGGQDAVGFSADSRRLVSTRPGNALLWDMTPGEVASIPIPGVTGPRTSSTFGKPIDVHGNEPICASGQMDGFIELWNLQTRLRIVSWQAHTGEVSAVAFSRDGRRIASGTTDGEVKIWDAATRRQETRFANADGTLLCLAFSPDGRFLAGSGECSSVWLWDVASKDLLLKLPTQNTVPSIAFSPDGKLLAAGTMASDEARLWEIPSGTPQATLLGHVQSVTGVAFTPDGKTLATGSHDRRVKLWNVVTQQEMVTLPLDGPFLSLKFSPDGRMLAVCYLHTFETTLEPRIRLWHVPSFDEIGALEAKERAERARP